MALLNWDELRRIRPLGFSISEYPWTRAVLEADSTAIGDVQPNDDELRQVGEEFSTLIMTRGLELRQRYGLGNIDQWPASKFGPTPAGGDPRLAHIFVTPMPNMSKMRVDLVETIEGERLGEYVRVESGIWLGLHPQLASVYMCSLTEEIASQRRLTPITDNRSAYRAAGRSTIDRLEEVLFGNGSSPTLPSADELQSHYVDVTLAAAIRPTELASVSIERIMEFRIDHRSERRALQAHINSLRSEILELVGISDRGEIQQRLSRIYRERTQPQLEELQAQLNHYGIRSIPGVLRLKIDDPASAQTLLGLGVFEIAHVAGVSFSGATPLAIGLTAIPYYLTTRRRRTQLRHGSPTSFLLSLSSELAGL